MKIYTVIIIIISLTFQTLNLNICHLNQQNADNNLEQFLLQDFNEMALNDQIQNESDNQHQQALLDRHDAYTNESMPNIQNGDGSKLSGEVLKPIKIQLMEGKMVVVDTLLETDLDEAQVFAEFIEWGQNECMAQETNNQKMDLFVLVMSSHGAGILGFGGDESSDLVPILNIHSIQSKIKEVTPNSFKFDIIGFDACLMQSIGVAGALSQVTNYILASVALEPGHGWDYSYLNTNANNAVNQATLLIDGFVESLHGYPQPMPEKTLSLIDATQFDSSNCNDSKFICQWNVFMEQMGDRLFYGDDFLYSVITMARNDASSQRGVFNEQNWSVKSTVDVYSLLFNINKLQIESLLEDDIIAMTQELMDNLLNNVVIHSNYGPNTPQSWGLGLFFIPYEQKENQQLRLQRYQTFESQSQMEMYDYFLNAQQLQIPPNFDDPSKCSQIPGQTINCMQTPHLDSDIQKYKHVISADSLMMETCSKNASSISNKLFFKKTDSQDQIPIADFRTRFSMCKSMAIFDNQIIGMFKDNIFYRQVQVDLKDQNIYTINIFIQNNNINPDNLNLKNELGFQNLAQGQPGTIQFSFKSDGTYEFYHVEKQEQTPSQYDGTLVNITSMDESATNYILLLDDFWKADEFHRLDKLNLRKIHMSQLNNVARFKLQNIKMSSKQNWNNDFDFENDIIEKEQEQNQLDFGGSPNLNDINFKDSSQNGYFMLIVFLVQLI